MGVSNHQIGAEIRYHDEINGFRSGIGTGTTSIKDNHLQQLTEMNDEFLYKIFLDLRKTYSVID